MTKSALSHLDDALVALADGDFAEDLAAIELALGGSTSLTAIAAAIRDACAEIRQARGLPVGSNVKPAPFFLNEKTVKEVLDAPVPVEGKLVDRPRRSEAPRLAKANDDCPAEPAPEPVPSPDQGDAPIPDDFGTPDHLSQAPEPIAPDADELDARRAFEQAVFGDDRGSRGSPRPIRATVHKGEKPPTDVIRAAARKLREAGEADSAPDERPAPIRVSGGAPSRFRCKPASEKPAEAPATGRKAKVIPANPIEARQARFRAAEAFLKAAGVAVVVAYPDAAIRTYRVTGRRLAVLAEDVIEMAIERGMSA